MERPYKYLTESNELDSVLPEIFYHSILGVDVETTELKPRDGVLLTVQVATPELTYVFNATKMDITPLISALMLYDGLVVIQNGKFDLQFLFHNFGLGWWQGNFYDLFIAHRLKNVGVATSFKEKFVGLDRLSLGYLGYELNKEIRESFKFSDGNLTEDQVKYAAEDAAILIPLYDAMYQKVLDRQPENILNLEFNLLPVTAMMEYYGIQIDTSFWTCIADEKTEERAGQAETAKKIFSDHIDWDINLNSWKQLKKALNSYMGFDLPDTRAKTFQRHRYKSPELFDSLIAYKGLQKSVSTYGRNWLQHVDKDGNVYASFNQVGTDTGRYSCSAPNLQNIPIRNDSRYREAFIARPGYKLITADLSQIEYRLAGEFSGEEAIIEEYNRTHPDFHRLTAEKASKILDRDVDRFTGKTMNFALLYQAGPNRLVEELGCNRSEASALHSAFWTGYDTMRKYMYAVGYEAVARGHSETKLGRRRYFNITSSTPGWEIEKMQREGGNMPIQGSTADILKIATLLIFPKLIDFNSRLVHQVHDELIVETPEDCVEDVAHIVKTDMITAGESVLELVPVEVEISIGDTWGKDGG